MAAPKHPTKPDFEPKHRIVGAALLIGFAVLVFSLLLDSEGPGREFSPDAQADSTMPVPQEYVSSEEETRTFVSKITPIGGATPRGSEATPESPTTDKQDPPAQKNTKTVSKANPGSSAMAPPPKKTVAMSKPATQAVATVSAGDASLERGWMVRVGTFTDASNVERVMKDLRDKGFTPSSTPTKTASGAATRVWLGPFAQRVEAARVRSSLEQSTGEPGLITAFP
jgi:DedD protein